MLRGLQVLHEDNHLIAVNKPGGMLVHEDETNDRTLADVVKQYIKIRYNKPGDVFLGVIHRLDRPVSGVIVFARTSKGLSRMNDLFRERKVTKTYWAIVTERPEELSGTLEHFLLKDREQRKTKVYDRKGRRTEKAKKAILDYEIIGGINSSYLLKITPHTGRPHQIRAQLSHMGWPIRGDIKYGHTQANDNGTIYLHSRSLEFIHPIKKEPVQIVAELPGDPVWQWYEGIES